MTDSDTAGPQFAPAGPLFDAVREGDAQRARSLLDAGADINAQDKNGAAPLHRAVRTRCAAAVRCLLDAGADPALLFTWSRFRFLEHVSMELNPGATSSVTLSPCGRGWRARRAGEPGEG